MEIAKEKNKNLNYKNMLWLFIIGSLIGVLMEGLFCLVVHKHWETHVVSMWVPLCVIYGVGAVILYIIDSLLKGKNIFILFVVSAITLSVFELLCGLLLEFGLNMRAWDYSDIFLNFRGHICLVICLAWGVIGILFSKLLVKPIDKMFNKMNNKFWFIACILVSIFLVADFTLTFTCIIRWKNRHYNIEPQTVVERFIDNYYNDDFMQSRFCEWTFLE